MEPEILFKEKQHFKQWWLWLILLSVNGWLLFAAFGQRFTTSSFREKPVGHTAVLLSVGLTLLITIMFVALQLETQIKHDGVYVRFFPFQLSFRYYPWQTITRTFVRKYNPLIEYGGWGYRIGVFGKGRALNVSGNNGLQLEFYDNKKLLIGTTKPEELTKVLASLGVLTS